MVDPADRQYLLPPGRIVRRAREWYLYDQAGHRYLDFWQADGSAFLGHRPRGLSKTVAAELDRGLWGPVPTAWPGRLERALERLARSAEVSSLTVVNGLPAAARAGGDRWLPLGPPPGVSAPGLVVPVPGVSFGSTSLIQAAYARAALLLADYLETGEAQDRLHTAETIPVPPGWQRHGCWLIPATQPGGWGAFRREAAERGILLGPDATTPLVVPGVLSRGELTTWKGLVDDWPR